MSTPNFTIDHDRSEVAFDPADVAQASLKFHLLADYQPTQMVLVLNIDQAGELLVATTQKAMGFCWHAETVPASMVLVGYYEEDGDKVCPAHIVLTDDALTVPYGECSQAVIGMDGRDFALLHIALQNFNQFLMSLRTA